MKIKTLILISMLLLIGSSGKTQTNIYYPMLQDTTARWYEISNKTDGTSPLWKITTYLKYFLKGDTIINLVNYKKIYRCEILKCNHYTSGSILCYDPGSCSANSYAYYCAMREDSIQKKVYFIPRYLSIEYNLFDFNLNVGDTATYQYFGYNTENIIQKSVQHRDSMLLGSIYHRRITFGLGSSWVTELGSVAGFTMTDPIYGELSFCLLCFEKNNQILYYNLSCNNLSNPTSFLKCIDMIPIGIKEYAQNNYCIIYPTIFNTHLYVETSLQNTGSVLSIYLNDGHILKTEKINTLKTIIDTENLKEGIYFYEILNLETNQIIQRGKIIKIIE